MAYAEVAVNSPGADAHTFSYSIPDHLSIRPGHVVRVPFGTLVREGVVVAVSDAPSFERTRPVDGLVADEPSVSDLHLGLAAWMRERYLTTPYDSLSVMLPPAFARRQRTVVSLVPGATIPQGASHRSELDAQLAERIVMALGTGGAVDRDAFLGEMGRSREAVRALRQLERTGIVRSEVIWERPRVGPRFERSVSLRIPEGRVADEVTILRTSGAPKQADALSFLAGWLAHDLPLADARKWSGIEAPVWQALERKGLVGIASFEIRRDPLESEGGSRGEPSPGPALTPHQRAATREITGALERGVAGAVFLLHGVTGSGKTEVYLQALARTIAMGKRGIILVPEIALTPQTVGRFVDRFPGRVAVLHSGLTLREQYDEWRNIQDGRFDVVIGPRRAVMAPVSRLGLVVVDEEQEWSYKQDEPAPRYHARDVAIELARRAGAVVVLGSATPNVESMYSALRGRVTGWTLLELPGRVTTAKGTGQYVDRPMAHVDVIDLRDELSSGNRSIFSRELQAALSQALGAGEQAILFLNRRGAGAAVQCRACGHTLTCSRCSVSLTYHADGSIVCHHCGRLHRALPVRCPTCGKSSIRPIGLGTQRIAAEAQKLFPVARVARWDRDAVREAGGHEAVLGAFVRHEADILVGTQMLAKGLDLPRVTVVGVVSADIGLHVPNFRAGERTFQLLCQVAGRSGRGEAPGRVIIQTYQPQHYAVRAAAAQDYRQFYLQEIGFRRALGYPPFSRVARLLYAHSSARAAREEVERVARLLQTEVKRQGLENVRLVGPAPAAIERLRGRYRWQLEIFAADPAAVVRFVTLPPRWIVDIDALNLS